ncbi:MAG: transglycosylase domain-containing protein [Phycisphaerae bacterium]|nr:transglycosylase domain-containing protein [Phycisphaerae bacterium]
MKIAPHTPKPLSPRRRLAIAAGAAVIAAVAVLAITWRAYPFPLDRLERWPASPLVTARDGTTLLTLVGDDDHWRFPVPLDQMSPWLPLATKAVEDERFDSHPGVDPIALVRAIGQNLSAARVVSGASTLTMQICRMMDDRPRTLRAKLVESFRALQLERRQDKNAILETYLNIAPYGGNVRGVEAASLVYFGKRSADLSLAEAALLAGLPQSPSRYRPDRHPDRAKRRRNVVLARMLETGAITEPQRAAASDEPVALSRPQPSRLAPHTAWLALHRRPAGGQTTIDPDIQRAAASLAHEHAATLPDGSDLAVVVIDIATADVVAMIGSANVADPTDGQVNGAVAPRSPGSALKPFVYAAAFETQSLNDESTVYDVPIHRAGWSPTNFDGRFAGELPAAEALRRSLNVPAILVAESTGLARCIGQIEAVGVKLPDDARQRGGLAVVVGAVEVTLLDLTNAYATLARTGIRKAPRLFLDDPTDTPGDPPAQTASSGVASHRLVSSGVARVRTKTELPLSECTPSKMRHRTSARPPAAPCSVPCQNAHPPLSRVTPNATPNAFAENAASALEPNVCRMIDDILSSRRRRPAGTADLDPRQIPWFMWKTGTSSGRRDAWAVGHNHRFAIGVWVGRFSGLGSPTFVGAQAAEPLLARLFAQPALRNDQDPTPPTRWPARTTLRPPDSQDQPLRIATPHNGATFIAIDGESVIHPKANRPAPLTWFLNGTLLPPAQANRLVLPPGHYTLQCVDVRGGSARTTFDVRRP